VKESPSWNRVKEVFQAALEQTPEARSAFVRQTCGTEDALRREVESLLAAFERAGTFVERPAVESLTASAALAATMTLDAAGRALRPGDTIGPYQIIEFAGAGGMGEVYRARDCKLFRDVALKVQSGAFAFDADRLARFNREAQVLASLNHPNIAAIYGLEESDGIQALVLEHVQGPTLAHRISTAPLLVDEALAIAKQIAAGLEAAHARGIVHRDLKPANIKLRPDGTVKILDFGLAKAFDASDSSPLALDEAALTGPTGTCAGIVFGTAAYMSPEQALGKAVDKRTDVWAFGCVLYETLTGQQAFHGETVRETLAMIVGHGPDWSRLPVETPASVVTLLHRCLEKDPGRRLHDIADARIEIEQSGGRPAMVAWTRRRRLGAWAVAAVIAIALATAAEWQRAESPTPRADRTVRRLQIRLPDTGSLADAQLMPLGLGQRSIAISPDGARLAYVLERKGVRQLYRRALDELDGAPIARTEGAFSPFFSPNGAWIGFFADNKLKKVAVSGGDPVALCATQSLWRQLGNRRNNPVFHGGGASSHARIGNGRRLRTGADQRRPRFLGGATSVA
jgi:serine/threonine-protein kinase